MSTLFSPQFLVLMVVLSGLSAYSAQTETLKDYSYQDLKPCSMSSLQLGELGPDDELEPCVIYEVLPTFIEDELQYQILQPKGPIYGTYGQTSVISMVQVTPSNCFNHRDGAPTAVHLLNQDNDGKGVAIGFSSNGSDQSTQNEEATRQQYYVQFHFVSVVAGNPSALSEEEYNRRHGQILESMIEYLNAPYVVGTCSFASEVEKQVTTDHKAFLMAQVGPPGFYTDQQQHHPYLFGFHINSDLYTLPNVQSLIFLTDEQRQYSNIKSELSIKVIYRTKSEFFYSTCRSAIDHLIAGGLTNIEEFLFDHSDDHDGDEVTNEFDEDFLRDLADQACTPHDHEIFDQDNHTVTYHPAFFICTLTEHDIMIRRWLETGCRPISVWLAAATWAWADDNLNLVPYFQGGGQWHPAFSYSDMFFDSGSELLRYNERQYGYAGNYDQIVDYAIPVLFAQHLVSAYRVVDDPDPIADFASEAGREALRRDMLVLKADTLFGPVSFDDNQRNNGREAAGSQWLPNKVVETPDEENAEQPIQFVRTVGNPELAYANRLVAPLLQAEAATVIVAPAAQNCQAGNFVNETKHFEDGSILSCGCTPCPVDTFLQISSTVFSCNTCPSGSTTKGLEGQEVCYAVNDNLLSPSILAFGYTATAATWILSIAFMIWIWMHRQDPVVKMSQMEFLNLICVGAMISSSTIIALSFQAASGEPTQQATAGCTAAPFLYAIGWALQYSSLSAKTYRLFLIMRNNQHLKRVKVTFLKMLRIVFIVLIIDLALLISWTLTSPLVYERSEENVNIDKESGVATIETVGSCVMEDNAISFWAFASPIMGFHFCLLIGTNYLLYCVRNVADRYQEQKYIAMASVLIFEILIVGLPVMVAVNDSPIATHIILVGIIAVSDIGILCFTFVPKIIFQRKGLGDGISFGESIMRSTHQKASLREGALRQSGNSFYNYYSNAAASDVVNRMQVESSNYSIDESRAGPRLICLSGRVLVQDSIPEEGGELDELEESDLNGLAAEKTVMECTERQTSDRSHLTIDGECYPNEKKRKPADLMNEHQQTLKMTANLLEENPILMTNTRFVHGQEQYRRRPIDEEGKKGSDMAKDEVRWKKSTSTSPPPIHCIIDTSEGNDMGGKVDSTAAEHRSEVTETTEETSKDDANEKDQADTVILKASTKSSPCH